MITSSFIMSQSGLNRVLGVLRYSGIRGTWMKLQADQEVHRYLRFALLTISHSLLNRQPTATSFSFLFLCLAAHSRYPSPFLRLHALAPSFLPCGDRMPAGTKAAAPTSGAARQASSFRPLRDEPAPRDRRGRPRSNREVASRTVQGRMTQTIRHRGIWAPPTFLHGLSSPPTPAALQVTTGGLSTRLRFLVSRSTRSRERGAPLTEANQTKCESQSTPVWWGNQG
jgi:hypothetical protein